MGSTHYIEPLRKLVDERNATLEKQVAMYQDVFQKVQEKQCLIKECMKRRLEVYNDITFAIREDCDDTVVDEDKFAVEIAKLSYSNLLDNHSLRADPPTNGILKDEFRWIRSVFSEKDLGNYTHTVERKESDAAGEDRR